MGFLTTRERWFIAGLVALFVLGSAVRYARTERPLPPAEEKSSAQLESGRQDG